MNLQTTTGLNRPRIDFIRRRSVKEVDFITNMGRGVVAIEVKSGNYRLSRSLQQVMSDRYKVRSGIMIENGNIRTDEYGVNHYPLFATFFFEDNEYPDVGFHDFIEPLNTSR